MAPLALPWLRLCFGPPLGNFLRTPLVSLFYSSYEPKFIKYMITDYDVFCLRKNVLATLYRKLYEVLFQDNIANIQLGGFVSVHGEK